MNLDKTKDQYNLIRDYCIKNRLDMSNFIRLLLAGKDQNEQRSRTSEEVVGTRAVEKKTRRRGGSITGRVQGGQPGTRSVPIGGGEKLDGAHRRGGNILPEKRNVPKPNKGKNPSVLELLKDDGAWKPNKRSSRSKHTEKPLETTVRATKSSDSGKRRKRISPIPGSLNRGTITIIQEPVKGSSRSRPESSVINEVIGGVKLPRNKAKSHKKGKMILDV